MVHSSFPLRARALLVGGSLLALAGCADGRGGPVAYEPVGFGRPDVEVIPVQAARQTIGPLDKITVNVFQVPQLSGEHQVDLNGNVDLPLIGVVKAVGRTLDEFSTDLEARYGAKYLRNPNISVAMMIQTIPTITVEGAVGVPGVFPIQGETTLIKAVALAKGTTPDANPSRVVIMRRINGQRMAAAYDLTAIRRAQAEDPIIYGNDIIVVDGSKTRGLIKDILSAIPLLGVFNPF